MRIQFDPLGWDDFYHWIESDPKTLARLREIIRDTRRNPFSGIGKPEPLKGEWQGFWSRRITREHRLVYRVTGPGDTQILQIAMCRYHYERR
ncbi:Txe/YoeB family addiction module toxin [Zhengella sp. ZM62]|uniref:Txe/YoeB family addiction module toxin n=1 Tax=Zhengella sedimenti TaxID=3390035 RepID=UPI003976BD05